MARLLYLHQHFSTPAGSTATRSHAQARALVRAGHAVTLATGRFEGAVTGLDTPLRRGRREGLVDGIRVVEFAIPYGNAMGLAARSLAFLRYAARATRLAAAEPWDAVIASSTPLTVALPALEARRRHGTPFLFEMRDPWPELPAALGLRARPVLAAMGALADAACRRARRVVALSEGMAAIARGRGAAEVAVIPQGADLDLFGPQVAPWRPEGVGSHEILAVYAGAHGAANGLGLLLEAARLLAARPPAAGGERRVRLVLVGEGAAKPALVRQAEGLPNLTFLDPLPKRQLAGLLAGAQVGLLCLAPVPEFAGHVAPNKLVDVLAAGLPVLSNLPGETAELLAAHGAGETVGPRDAAGLADALTRLADDPARRRAMGEAARALAMRRFDRRLLTARFVAEVEACLP